MEMGVDESINSRYSIWVREALDELPHSFSIADPWIPGHPIVFASKELLKMSGYSREEVIGKNGRMFQGIKTNRRSVMEIRRAVREERSIQVSLLNYKKNGTPFWILFHMFPVFSKEDGRVIHFVGVQVPIIKRSTTTTRNINNIIMCRRELCCSFFEPINLAANDNDDLDDDNNAAAAAAAECTVEKQLANSAMSSILSMLTHYSQLTGRLVSQNRSSSTNYSITPSLYISLASIKQSFVLTDPHKTDIPIVYASDAFLELTGYARHEVLGRSCRFLSGQETDISTQLQITNSIQTGKSCTVNILNYRKDGSPFWNSLHISPVRNASGKAAYFVEVQMNANNYDEKQQQQQNLRPELSVVGAVKVAVRTSGMVATTSNS